MKKKDKRIVGILSVVAIILAVVAVVIYVEIAKIAREKQRAAAIEGMTTVSSNEDTTSWIQERNYGIAEAQNAFATLPEPDYESMEAIKIPDQLFQNDEELKQSVMSGYIQTLIISVEEGKLVLPEDAYFVSWDIESGDITYMTGTELVTLSYEQEYRNVF